MGIFYHLPTPRRGAHREDDVMILNLKNLPVSSFPFTLSGPPITGYGGIKGQESLWLNNTFCSRWLLSKGNHKPYQKGQTAVGSWIGRIIWIEIRTQCSALIDTDRWKLRTTACVFQGHTTAGCAPGPTNSMRFAVLCGRASCFHFSSQQDI